jgi:iron complex outermembrane receptor protein
MKPIRHKLRLALGSSLALTSLAFAQSNTSSSTPPADDETVRLSEFTVHETTDHGYIAQEAVTGTRVATQIKDLPFAISVITSEFMKDFDFFDLAGDMAYTASLNGVDTQGNSNLRGYGATFTLRNGFYRLGLNERVNTDRIEIIKGPNAAIYGSTSPAGLINYVSKKPRSTPFQTATFTAGGDDMVRGEVEVHQPLGSIAGVKLYSLFTAEVQNEGSDTPYAFLRKRTVSGSVLAKFKDGSSLSTEFEWSKRQATPATSAIPFVWNSVTKYTSVERRDLANFSQGGPDSVANRELTSGYLTYEKRWNDVFSNRVGGYIYARHAFNFNNGTSDQFDPTTGRFSRGNVVTDPLNEDGGGIQVDTLADYHLLGGKIKAKTLLTVDVSQNWRYREQRRANSKTFPITGVLLSNPDYSLPPRSAFNIITRRDKVRWDVQGAFLHQQLSLMNGRLLAYGGLRHDSVTYNFNFGDQFSATSGALSNPGAVSHYTDTAWSPNFGVNFKVVPTIALYASHSTSFSPAGQVAKLGDPHLENETSVGWDYGVKASYLQDRLVFTLGGFYIDRYGVKANVKDPLTGVTESVAAGTQLSRGIELEGSYRVTDNLFLQLSASTVNAKIRFNGTDKLTDIGRHPATVPADQASFVWKYTFTQGRLRGLAWNAGLVYTGEAYPNSTATDARRDVKSDAVTIVNTGLTYTWNRSESRIKQSVRLSAKNLFNREYEDAKGSLGADRGIFFAYTVSH